MKQFLSLCLALACLSLPASALSHTVVRGDTELEKGIVMLKNMSNGEQQELSAENLADQLKQLITK